MKIIKQHDKEVEAFDKEASELKERIRIKEDELKVKVAKMIEDGNQPTLAVVIVGDDPASHVYVRNKKRACEYVGIL